MASNGEKMKESESYEFFSCFAEKFQQFYYKVNHLLLWED